MAEHSLNDPQLQAIEARLAAIVPRVSPSDERELLYRCAYQAGHAANRRSVRNWRAAAAALAVMLVGLSVPLTHDHWPLATRTAEPTAPVVAPHGRAQAEIPAIARHTAPVELDAWQLRPSDRASLDDELARFEQTDPHLRSLAVGTLTRAVFEP